MPDRGLSIWVVTSVGPTDHYASPYGCRLLDGMIAFYLAYPDNFSSPEELRDSLKFGSWSGYKKTQIMTYVELIDGYYDFNRYERIFVTSFPWPRVTRLKIGFPTLARPEYIIQTKRNGKISMDTEREKDILLMLFAVQVTLFLFVIPSWMWPLFLFPVLLTVHVMISEYHRRLENLPEK